MFHRIQLLLHSTAGNPADLRLIFGKTDECLKITQGVQRIFSENRMEGIRLIRPVPVSKPESQKLIPPAVEQGKNTLHFQTGSRSQRGCGRNPAAAHILPPESKSHHK